MERARDIARGSLSALEADGTEGCFLGRDCPNAIVAALDPSVPLFDQVGQMTLGSMFPHVQDADRHVIVGLVLERDGQIVPPQGSSPDFFCWRLERLFPLAEDALGHLVPILSLL